MAHLRPNHRLCTLFSMDGLDTFTATTVGDPSTDSMASSLARPSGIFMCIMQVVVGNVVNVVYVPRSGGEMSKRRSRASGGAAALSAEEYGPPGLSFSRGPLPPDHAIKRYREIVAAHVDSFNFFLEQVRARPTTPTF